MAVTQLLVRVPEALLAECRADSAALEGVVSFAAAPRNFHLDLDWSPAPLHELMRCARQPAEVRAALRRACDGVRPVNPDFPEGTVEVAPCALDPTEAAGVSVILDRVDANALFATSVGADDGCNGYLRQHFEALRRFYAEAAGAGHAVIVWWD